jgi:hypothetical protein
MDDKTIAEGILRRHRKSLKGVIGVIRRAKLTPI